MAKKVIKINTNPNITPAPGKFVMQHCIIQN
jgi:hypothetical protein